MAVAPQKVREATFQMLYSYDMGHSDDDAIVELLSGELAIPKSALRTVQQRVKIIHKHLLEIDTLIAETSIAYDFDRIQRVERNVLRLGVYELLYDTTVPTKVVFAECMRLATKFSTKESASFINAILDAIVKKKEGSPIIQGEIDHHSQKLQEQQQEIDLFIENMDNMEGSRDPHE